MQGCLSVSGIPVGLDSAYIVKTLGQCRQRFYMKYEEGGLL